MSGLSDEVLKMVFAFDPDDARADAVRVLARRVAAQERACTYAATVFDAYAQHHHRKGDEEKATEIGRAHV